MQRDKLFDKYYKNPNHGYEISETLSATTKKIDIAFVYSGRNRGKSFEISSQLIADAYYDNRLFGYIRRNDATSYDIEQYFADKREFIQDMSDGVYNGITRSKGKLYFYSEQIDEESGEAHKVLGACCGYFYALSRQASYKSLQYPDVYNLIYEEVLTDGSYLSAEPEKLMNLYSTVRRSKPDFMMWLVSNTVSVVNPYSKSWGIYLARNKPGDIRLSKLYLGSYNEKGEEDYLLIAAHYLVNKNDLSKVDLKKKRNRIKTGIASNKWDELKLFTTIDISFMRDNNFDILDTVIFEYDDMMIQCDIVEIPSNTVFLYVNNDPDEEYKFSKDMMPILYFRRKTSKIKDFTRVYTNNPEQFNEYTTKGFKTIYKIDKIVRAIYERGWIIGADNLTMNDFSNIFKKLVLI